MTLNDIFNVIYDDLGYIIEYPEFKYWEGDTREFIFDNTQFSWENARQVNGKVFERTGRPTTMCHLEIEIIKGGKAIKLKDVMDNSYIIEFYDESGKQFILDPEILKCEMSVDLKCMFLKCPIVTKKDSLTLKRAVEALADDPKFIKSVEDELKENFK